MTETPPEKSAKPVPLRVVSSRGQARVRAAVEGAVPFVPAGGGPAGDDPHGRGDYRSAKWPVTPLGINGDVCYYLDAGLQLRAFHFRDHQRLGIQSLFGQQSAMLENLWPRKRANGAVAGVDYEAASTALMAAAAAKGVWQPFERLRGPGAWQGAEGNLILHMGDEILIGAVPGTETGWRRCDPGLIEGHVYPASAPGPRPAPESWPGGDVKDGPAGHFLKILNTWNFRRAETDSWLLMGAAGAAMIGGAFDWRPSSWITGQAGTGKSTLQHVLEDVMGGAMIAVSDTTAAGIWQKIGHSTCPVWIDEAEATEDNRRMDAVIRFARQASSGGIVLRGGKDHDGAEFTARNVFFFSAIDMPPLETQDMQRNAIFSLGPLPMGGAPYQRDARLLGVLGTRLLRRMIDGWDRFRVTLDIYGAALSEVGHTSRGIAQFGTLLACADLLFYDEVPGADFAASWAERLAPDDLAEIQDAGRAEMRCVQWLLGSTVDPYRSGTKKSIGEWVMQAAGIAGDYNLGTADRNDANRVLGLYGLKVEDYDGRTWVVLANFHTGLSEIYGGTRWASKASASLMGWVQQWRRLPGAEWSGEYNKSKYFSGAACKATWVPLAAVFPDMPRAAAPARDDDDTAL